MSLINIYIPKSYNNINEKNNILFLIEDDFNT